MDDILKIIELAEHPERFGEDEMAALLADDEALAMYTTVCEVGEVYARNVAERNAAERKVPERNEAEGKAAESLATKPHGTEKQKARVVGLWRWAAVAACVAAVAVVGWMMVSGPATNPQGTEEVLAKENPVGDDLFAVQGDNLGETDKGIAPSQAGEADLIAKNNVTEASPKGEDVPSNNGNTGLPPRATHSSYTARLDASTADNTTTTDASADLDRQLRLMQARIDSDIAGQMAELYLAEYYARQIENLQPAELPVVEAALGDDIVPSCGIMTLVME